ncbi:nuclear transport factor 2 family protein (plasmid) [Brevundimonas staleyi]|uniref:Nuclear transport factor 2 family protein n=1 Tax=Brevundimonas staleyi TaxID=74326 RepID=A0ABW0FPT8_9CAUL
MNEQNLGIAQQLLEKIGAGAPPAEVAALVSEDISFEIPGDETALPWIGKKVGRQAFADFIRDQREMLVSNAFQVDDILVSDTRAVILGELSATIKQSGKVAETYFAIILTIADGLVVRFQMLEDSFAASQAAR